MPRHLRHAKAGFTLIEMLLVVAILSLLISIVLPVLTNSKEAAWIVVCKNNQHQVHTAISNYAHSNQRRFLYNTTQNNGNWMWDITTDGTTQLVASAGGKVDIFFCPSNAQQNATVHWNFTTEFRVLGYFFLFKRANGPMATFNLAAGKQWVRGLSSHYNHSSQELITDGNLSVGGNFATIYGGSPIPHRSAHLDPKTLRPTGGNILFLDGHVQWRPFEQMQLRYWGPDHWY